MPSAEVGAFVALVGAVLLGGVFLGLMTGLVTGLVTRRPGGAPRP